MSALHIQKKLKELGAQSRSMRWSRDLRSLTTIVRDTKTPKDFFFEFWCYLSAVKTVDQEIAKVTLVVPAGQTYAVWPLKPGAPINFSYFSFTVNKTALGIFPGVEFGYKNIASTSAPDISIRSALTTTAQPRIYAVWDAKYRDDPGKRISRNEVYAFSTARRLISISRSKPVRQTFSNIAGMPCFRSCGLITNGRFSAEHGDTLQVLGLFETEKFGTPSEATRP